MGKPRLIILIRHAQSEGNKDRDIHQFIPDHRVKLTPHGVTQAEEAGRQLRSLLKPDDTIQFFTSPYRRTRETTEGILRTLTSDDPTPSPFPRNKIKVFEEPRLREQDFGNFQPCSAEMERMWQERADYGHFFYRIPDGESAADAYDRVSGFNESLWRQFGDEDFPSVAVLVTHGLMTRVFLMKWYHWSVEYFEDLRNVNHCEFMIMKRSDNNGKYILENELRTWSELKRRTAANGSSAVSSTSSRPTPVSTGQSNATSSPTIPVRKWGGCVNGCNHDRQNWPKRPMRKNTIEYLGAKEHQLPPAASSLDTVDSEMEDQPVASQDPTPTIEEPSPAKLSRKYSTKAIHHMDMPEPPASPNDASNDASSSEPEEAAISIPRKHQHTVPRTAAIARHLQPPQTSGEGFSDDSDYFPGMQHLQNHRSILRASSKQRHQSKERKLQRRQTEQSWKEESGMGTGTKTDRLGDGDTISDDAGHAKSEAATSKEGMSGPILKEALKGDMVVEKSEEDRERSDEEVEAEKKSEAEIDKMQEEERKGMGEIY
ncbi:phosphoglycerate mutase-like protein [Ophiobolus disseminans]|uniref:Phosphoglycerate mutase-like protein n=1 Tax=Ophiobolus disseminans TaxID=1469910 RepID=A0A6A7AI63_9PLEO|nr:phosphoglycerate mutase-like protein [Ophiobolus disseminans]